MKERINIEGKTYVLENKTTEGMQYCIIRGHGSGVHAGFVEEYDKKYPTVVKLKNSRRLWRWHAKTLSGLATEGTTNESYCKFANEIPEILLPDMCEMIPCSEKSINFIREFKEWENE